MDERDKSLLMLAAAGVGAVMSARLLMNKWREMDLRGRTVLITGGSRGLGLLLAREFALQGAKVAICARDVAELDRAEATLSEFGSDTFSFPCDVTIQKQVDRLVGEVNRQVGPIDVLVNNAGVISVGPMEVMTLEDYDKAMKTHFWGPLFTTLAVLPQMQRRKRGRIVNISSIGGKVSVPHLLPYSASKFALVGFSEGLRSEVAKDNIAVTTVIPGLMRTGSPYNANFKGQNEKEYAWFSISDSIPLLSMNAQKAAREIVTACKRGDAELVLTLPAEVAVIFHGLFPGLTSDILAWVNGLLPGPGGIGTESAKGHESFSKFSPSFLTTLTDRAAERNNELS